MNISLNDIIKLFSSTTACVPRSTEEKSLGKKWRTHLRKYVWGIIKSITAREIFRIHAEVKKMLWGGKFWTSGYYANTVGQYGNEKIIREYVKKQGKTYHQIHRGQLTFFDDLV